MENNQYKRGSEWRKWDLHVHSPDTKLNDQYKDIDSKNKWDLFCEKIENSDIPVFGITDYFLADNYFEFIDKFKNKYPNSKKIFFPNLEFRIDSKNSGNDNIQFHVIFSNSIDKNKIYEFFTRLPLISTDDDTLKNKYCTKDDLEQVTYKKAMIRIDELTENLKKDFTDNEYLIIGVCNGYGSLRPKNNDGKGAEYAKELDKKCHLFFGSSNNTDFYLNKQEGREKFHLPAKPVLSCSDAHKLEDIGKEFTWIKADPTFEGLKQIIYEPEERVKIQPQNPAFEFDKPFFSKIRISNEVKILENENVSFKDNEISLNKSLVTFIGGRGTGKSLFLKYLGNRFNKVKATKKDTEDIFTSDQDFTVVYQKENTEDGETAEYKGKENNLDFVFIEQSKIKNITEGEGLKNEIRKLLGLEDLKFDEKLNVEISRVLQKIQNLEKWFQQKDENKNLVNSEEYHEKIKQENKKLLETITTESNKEKLETYTNNIKKIEKLKSDCEIITDFEAKLRKYKKELNNDIAKINSFFTDDKTLNLQNINFDNQIETIRNQKYFLENKKTELENNNAEIKTKFEEAGFKGDLITLLKNATTYQEKIEQANKKLEEIEAQKTNLKKLETQRKKLGEKIKKEYERQKDELQSKWDNLLQDRNEKQKEIIENIIKSNIGFEVSIKFDKDKFYKVIHKKVDKRSYKNTVDLETFFGISSLDNWFSFFCKKDFEDILNNHDHFKSFIKDIFFDSNIRSEYIQVLPELTYKKKTIDKLSAGQKGTLYLRLQLATDAFSTPIIFDQPEDDLDNKFIIDELVPMLKELKKYRQIIIATHNANLVVSADAEQIIVADNDEEKLSYISGAIENKEIQNKICEILEGGKDAFEKRRRKYNLQTKS